MIPALLPNYARADLAFERGEGAWLWTVDGRRFLDFGSGIATASLGHGHKHLAGEIAAQAAKLMHVSNLYRIPGAEKLAARLVANSFADSVFFCNSGAEANEGMIKMMRRAMYANGKPERYRIICFNGAFHGRTLATLAATGNEKYLAGFGPVVEGFDHVPYNNMNAVRDMIGPETCGIIVEPVQGEGGVRPADLQFLRDLRAVCDEFGIILGMDEVQTGMGRTGSLFAFQQEGILPDVVTLAKALGNGVPIGACLARGAAALVLTAGKHGSTFGGNPLACAAALAVLKTLREENLPERARLLGAAVAAKLRAAFADNPHVVEVRQLGLMIGVQLDRPCGELVGLALEQGLLINVTADSTIRLLPPLILGDEDAARLAEQLGALVNAHTLQGKQ